MKIDKNVIQIDFKKEKEKYSFPLPMGVSEVENTDTRTLFKIKKDLKTLHSLTRDMHVKISEIEFIS